MNFQALKKAKNSPYGTG